MKHHNILIVDDDPATIKVLGGVLCDLGKIRMATNGRDALRLAREATPDLVLLDAEMPDITGFQVCQRMKSDPELAEVPVIFITSHSEPAFEVAGLEMGASDFIGKPINAPLLLARVKTQLRVKDLTDELRRVSRIDPLTGLPNRSHFDQSLEREWLRARRGADPICLLLVNVDQFALYNGRYGYHAGDECLRTIGQALALACMRPADIVARFSGEEFALLLPQTDRQGAEHIARRVLGSLHTLQIPHEGSTVGGQVTVSIGVGCYDAQSGGWSVPSADWRALGGRREHACAGDLARAAIGALSFAKASGRARAALLDISACDRVHEAQILATAQAIEEALEGV
jgi:diguanylate cyclase (GGDEF)-like protein